MCVNKKKPSTAIVWGNFCKCSCNTGRRTGPHHQQSPFSKLTWSTPWPSMAFQLSMLWLQIIILLRAFLLFIALPAWVLQCVGCMKISDGISVLLFFALVCLVVPVLLPLVGYAVALLPVAFILFFCCGLSTQQKGMFIRDY